MKAFEPTFSSLYESTAPDWFRDAKFGIWSHWGPQSVPMFGDWYARNMYIEGTPQYEYHLRHYGHPSRFGYKDLCALWKAERFDPDGLMARYVRAGARYFVAQATHHDHFFNYASTVNRMNSVSVGPRKDICALWKAAADRHGLPFGLSEHLGASFSWWRVNKGADRYGPYAGVPYDGNDPASRDFYFDNAAHGTEDPGHARPWYTDDPRFHAYWQSAVTEMIDIFTPELLYTDGPLPFGGPRSGDAPPDAARYREGLEIVAGLYNASIAKHGRQNAVYLQKDRCPDIYRVGVLDIEKSQLADIAPDPWHTDTCLGNWFYDVQRPYKRPDQVIEMLVDIVSKNGTMLLNILQRPDGSIDEEAAFVLDALAEWFAVCAEGIHGTRPWRTFAEGDTRVVIDGFREDKTPWRAGDMRFTQRDNTVYAFMMGLKAGRPAVLRSFAQDTVASVRLLGAGDIPFTQAFGVLTAALPDTLPTPYVNALAVTLA